jgi:hypothetical protein
VFGLWLRTSPAVSCVANGRVVMRYTRVGATTLREPLRSAMISRRPPNGLSRRGTRIAKGSAFSDRCAFRHETSSEVRSNTSGRPRHSSTLRTSSDRTSRDARRVRRLRAKSARGPG